MQANHRFTTSQLRSRDSYLYKAGYEDGLDDQKIDDACEIELVEQKLTAIQYALGEFDQDHILADDFIETVRNIIDKPTT